jgi:hypothetical protein
MDGRAAIITAGIAAVTLAGGTAIIVIIGN